MTTATTTIGRQVLVSNVDHQELGQVGHVPAIVPDADYQMGFVRAERGHFENRERIFLWFQITSPGDQFGPQLGASTESLPRPRVARAKGIHQATPSRP